LGVPTTFSKPTNVWMTRQMFSQYANDSSTRLGKTLKPGQTREFAGPFSSQADVERYIGKISADKGRGHADQFVIHQSYNARKERLVSQSLCGDIGHFSNAHTNPWHRTIDFTDGFTNDGASWGYDDIPDIARVELYVMHVGRTGRSL
jgi:hypothetical protein